MQRHGYATRILTTTALACASLAAYAQQPVGADAILLTRTIQHSDGSATGQSIYRTNARGAALVAVTPARDGIWDASVSWSPDARFIAFSRTDERKRRTDLYVRDMRSGRETMGLRGYNTIWGPGNRIAAIGSNANGDSCATTLSWPARASKTLFCVSLPEGASSMAPQWQPVWSADGKTLFVAYTLVIGRLEPSIYEKLYRIDANTGKADLLYDSQAAEDAGEPNRTGAKPSPDGKFALYANERFDYATRTFSPVDYGSEVDPPFTKNGTKLAYKGPGQEENPRDIYEMTLATGKRRLLLRAPTPSTILSFIGWSSANKRMILYKADSNDTSPVPNGDHVVADPATQAFTTLPWGDYDNNSWAPCPR